MGTQTRDHVRNVATGENPAHHFEAAVRMRELLLNSELAAVESPRDYEKGASEIHRRYAWMQFADGQTRHVLLTVKRWSDPAAETDTLYALEALEVREPDVLPVGNSQGDRPSISSDSGDKLSRFHAGIKADVTSAASPDGAVDITPSFSISRARALVIRQKIENQTPLTVSTDGIPDLSTHEEALAWMKKNGVFGKTTHPKIDGSIHVSPTAVTRSVTQGLSKEKAAMMLILRKLVPDSISMETETLTTRMTAHRVSHKMVIDGVPHLARIVIDADSNGRRYYNHELSDVRPLQPNYEPDALQPDGPEFADTDELLRWMYGADAYPANDQANDERTDAATADAAQPWTPHKGFRAPGKNNGRFLGDRGNSEFEVSDTMADQMEVPRGTRVPWRIGKPDFFELAVPGPENKIPKQFEVPGLNGEHDDDKSAIVKYMAKRLGRTQAFIKNWLLENQVELHHSEGNSVQIVPYKIHGLAHSGRAQELRNERQWHIQNS